MLSLITNDDTKSTSIDTNPTINTRNLMKAFEKEVGLAYFQFQSYSDCILKLIPDIIDRFKVEVNTKSKNESILITMFNHNFQEPLITKGEKKNVRMTPMDARNRRTSYGCKLIVDVKERRITDGKVILEKIHEKIYLCDIPIMTKSLLCCWNSTNSFEMLECPFDEGGYFIENGKERVLVSYEKLKCKQPYYFRSNKGSVKAELRSSADVATRTILFRIESDKFGMLLAYLPSIPNGISIGIILKICGLTESDIRYIINMDNIEGSKTYIDRIIREHSVASTKEKAIELLSSILICPVIDKDSTIKKILSTEFIPHMGLLLKKKGILCCIMIKNIITMLLNPKIEDSDRDHFSNKRVDVSGVLLSDLFKSLMNKYASTLVKYLEKNNNVSSVIKKLDLIKKGIHHSMGTGVWGSSKNASSRTGVSQLLARGLSYAATIAHIKRIVTPAGKQVKSLKLRGLHPSHFGYIDPSDTPEGETCGIVKNYAIMVNVSTATSHVLVYDYIRGESKDILWIDDIKIFKNISNQTEMYINDDLIGYVNDEKIENVMHCLYNGRRIKAIRNDVSISYNFVDKQIKLYCCSGRMLRPLLTVKDGKLNITNSDIEKGWNYCVNMGLIQYIDNIEEEWSLVTTLDDLYRRPDATFCEIVKYAIFGSMGATIPFPDYNQAPRNSYQCTMGKQSLGIPCMNYRQRFDTSLHVLCYPQRQLIPTEFSDIFPHADMSSGFNAKVAIMCCNGFAQEDAIILNKSSVDRGMGMSVYFRNHELCETKISGTVIEKICIPRRSARSKSKNYSLLDERGIVKVGSRVEERDVIVGKEIYKSKEKKYKDRSLCIKNGEEGIVDSVYYDKNEEGFVNVNVKIRYLRIPQIGDKYATMCAQKGTVGMIYNQEDMPFNNDGTPDIIVNPAYLPSRMTVSQPITSNIGKLACITGKKYYSTPFENLDLKQLEDEMRLVGLSPSGEEQYICGTTGKMLKSLTFVGIIQFQKLKHMVADKQHSRSRGPVTHLYRQPSSGKANDGGLKTGEMEESCIAGHGMSAYIMDRMLNCSDKFIVYICKNCRTFATGKNNTCRNCSMNDIAATQISYAAKQLLWYMMSIGIKILVEPKS